MAFADRLKGLFKQGEGAIAANKDKAHQAVDKAAAEADKRTHGKYSDQIHQAEQKADEAVDRMREQEGGATGQHRGTGDQGGTGARGGGTGEQGGTGAHGGGTGGGG